MKRYIVALSELQMQDRLLLMKWNESHLSEILIGLRALDAGKIDRLTLAPSDGSAKCKVIFTADGIMQALCDGKRCDFRLNDNHFSAIEGLLLDFLLESAFEGEHLDLELPLAETGILYDCVIGIGK